jgi:phosphopantothenoylcysteine synthetase/decarboxylase
LHSNAKLTHIVLALLREPKSAEELCSATSESPTEIESLLALLDQQNILISGSEEVTRSVLATVRSQGTITPVCRRLVIGICGTIYACQVVNLILMLKRRFAEEVDVILTAAANEFVRPEIFSYFGIRVWTDPYKVINGANVPHMFLACNADLVFIIPGSSHTIHRIASGECSDLLSLVAAATTAPVAIAPAMNSQMFAFPPIKDNLERLRSAGIYVIEPGLAFAASKPFLEESSFSGVGVRDTNVIRVLSTILATHKERSQPAKSIETNSTQSTEIGARRDEALECNEKR